MHAVSKLPVFKKMLLSAKSFSASHLALANGT